MADGNSGGNNNINERKPRSKSFFGALLERSTSFRGDDELAIGEDDSPMQRHLYRSRSMSESQKGESDQLQNASTSAILPNTESRARNMSLTSALLGRSFVERQNSLHQQTPADTSIDEGVGHSTEGSEIHLQENRQENITQNDHLNKRLLTSFLEKLNLGDIGKSQPTATETSGHESHPFSDDFLMDRICKRLEKDK